MNSQSKERIHDHPNPPGRQHRARRTLEVLRQPARTDQRAARGAALRTRRTSICPAWRLDALPLLMWCKSRTDAPVVAAHAPTRRRGGPYRCCCFHRASEVRGRSCLCSDHVAPYSPSSAALRRAFGAAGNPAPHPEFRHTVFVVISIVQFPGRRVSRARQCWTAPGFAR